MLGWEFCSVILIQHHCTLKVCGLRYWKIHLENTGFYQVSSQILVVHRIPSSLLRGTKHPPLHQIPSSFVWKYNHIFSREIEYEQDFPIPDMAHKKRAQVHLLVFCSSDGRMSILKHPRRKYSHKLERPWVSESLSKINLPANLLFWIAIWGRNRFLLYLTNSTSGLISGSHSSVACFVPREATSLICTPWIPSLSSFSSILANRINQEKIRRWEAQSDTRREQKNKVFIQYPHASSWFCSDGYSNTAATITKYWWYRLSHLL